MTPTNHPVHAVAELPGVTARRGDEARAANTPPSREEPSPAPVGDPGREAPMKDPKPAPPGPPKGDPEPKEAPRRDPPEPPREPGQPEPKIEDPPAPGRPPMDPPVRT